MKHITPSEYQQCNEKYGHLVNIGIPGASMVENDEEWVVRDEFKNAGTLMVGDLRVKHSQTKKVEIHPFPEWVVMLSQIGQKSGKMYCVFPNFSVGQTNVLSNLPWHKRCQKIQAFVDLQSLDTWVSILYNEGVSIKINANVPHEFLAITEDGEVRPYAQVFEPNIESISEMFHIPETTYFNLKDKLKI